ncbi:MAG TPA: hypothetical protein VNW06_03980 [Cytophagaceae bacterium]|jgi:hypothetical protein|nr:hypothetical protein [Cytophagaceae bacterium]
MDVVQLKLLNEELKSLPDKYMHRVLEYINILKSVETKGELKPMSIEDFMARYEISEKQIEDGNLIALEDAEKYLKKKNE